MFHDFAEASTGEPEPWTDLRPTCYGQRQGCQFTKHLRPNAQLRLSWRILDRLPTDLMRLHEAVVNALKARGGGKMPDLTTHMSVLVPQRYRWIRK
jgi:hypothetical protein